MPQPSFADPVNPSWSVLAGPLGEIFIHESGHAAAMLSFGIGVSSFRPFPHICGGKLVGGCVIQGSRFGRGMAPFLSSRAQAGWISASGSLFSMIGALALSPQIPKIRNEFNRKTLESMTYLQVRDFPFYVLADLLGFDGDWRSVSKNMGISLWWFLPIAVGQYVVLDNYWQRYSDEAAKLYDTEINEKRSGKVYWLPPFKWRL